jgi:hypothetical protein
MNSKSEPITNRASSIAWLLCALTICMATMGLIVWWSQVRPQPWTTVIDRFGWGCLLPTTYSILAATIISRQPRNRVGWLMMLTGIASAFSGISSGGLLAMPRSELTPGLWLLLWFDNWSWIPLVFPVMLIPLHFPTGRPPSPKWRWVNWLAVAMWLFFILASPFFGSTVGPMDYAWRLPNPLPYIPDTIVNGPILFVWGMGLVVMLVASMASLVVRYRHADATERLQIRWLAFAGGVFIIVYIPTYFFTDPNAFADPLWISLLLLFGIMNFAFAIAIAILRYRLYDIDIIIRRTLVYTLVTGALALVYVGSIIVLQRLFVAVTGQQSTVAIVISTLLIAALFNPLRTRTQTLIDRRFYRRKYDAEATLARFGAVARDEVNLETLTTELLGAVDRTVKPSGTSLWLRDKQL